MTQRLAGDTAGAKVTAEQAHNTLEQLSRDQPDSGSACGIAVSILCIDGREGFGPKRAERAMMLVPRAKDPVSGPQFEENLASIQTMFGENSRAISTLTQLLQTPYLKSNVSA